MLRSLERGTLRYTCLWCGAVWQLINITINKNGKKWLQQWHVHWDMGYMVGIFYMCLGYIGETCKKIGRQWMQPKQNWEANKKIGIHLIGKTGQDLPLVRDGPALTTRAQGARACLQW